MSTIHDMIPALPRAGSESVSIAASNKITALLADIPVKRAVLFQLALDINDSGPS